jgi:hypothetical protein
MIVFGSVMKSEDDESIGEEEGGEEKEGNRCFQSALTKSLQIQTFFSHVKQ